MTCLQMIMVISLTFLILLSNLFIWIVKLIKITMAFDLKKEEEVKDYIENLGIEYRFGCYKEKKPEVCHLLGDYLEAIKKDFEKAGKVYKSNCLDYKFGKSCLKFGNYTLVGRGRDKGDAAEALTYFEKGCELDERGACLHAGMLLTATGPGVKIKRDVPRGMILLLLLSKCLCCCNHHLLAL